MMMNKMVSPPVLPVTERYKELEAAKSLVELGEAQPKMGSNLHISEDKKEKSQDINEF